MEIREDGGVSLDFNETLFITREMANKYKNHARQEKVYQSRVDFFKDKPDSLMSEYRDYATRKLEHNKMMKKKYQSWYNLYELLLKNKRFKK